MDPKIAYKLKSFQQSTSNFCAHLQKQNWRERSGTRLLFCTYTIWHRALDNFS